MKVTSGTDILVTKYRRLFTKAVRDDARIIFASACADFSAELGGMAQVSVNAG